MVTDVTQKISVNFPDELAYRARVLAAKRRMTLSELVIRAVRETVEEGEHEQPD